MAAFCNAEVGDDGKAEELYVDSVARHRIGVMCPN